MVGRDRYSYEWIATIMPDLCCLSLGSEVKPARHQGSLPTLTKAVLLNSIYSSVVEKRLSESERVAFEVSRALFCLSD